MCFYYLWIIQFMNGFNYELYHLGSNFDCKNQKLPKEFLLFSLIYIFRICENI